MSLFRTALPEEAVEVIVAREVAMQLQAQTSDMIEDRVAAIVDERLSRAIPELDATMAEAVTRLKAEVLEVIPRWVRDAEPFPMTFEAVGRLWAEEHQSEFRFGSYRDDLTPRWYWRRGPAASPWLPCSDGVLRDTFRGMKERLAQRAHVDCFPSEAVRRLDFIEKRCASGPAYDAAFAEATCVLGVPD